VKALTIFVLGLATIHAVLAEDNLQKPKQICKIVNVRPLTKEELEAKGVPQINYGTIYLQQLVCQPKEQSK
jgi:hypothetical protein